MAQRYFARGSGAYTCRRCETLTRDTGQGEAQHDLCAVCYEIESMENQHSDDDHDGDLLHCSECRPQLSVRAIKELELEDDQT